MTIIEKRKINRKRGMAWGKCQQEIRVWKKEEGRRKQKIRVIRAEQFRINEKTVEVFGSEMESGQ